MITLILTLIAIVAGLLYYCDKKLHRFEYWSIPHPTEVPFLGVIIQNLIRQPNISDYLKEIYNLDKDAKYAGLHVFNVPIIIVRDLELIKAILVKDFDHFSDRVDSQQKDVLDPLIAKNLTSLKGDEWRQMRNLLSPAFTSSKMRSMFDLMSECAENFSDNFVELFNGKPEIDIKEAFSKYTNDVIATCAFGLVIDSLKNPNNEFLRNGKLIVDPPKGFKKYKIMLQLLVMTYIPKVAKLLGWKLMSDDVSKFFIDTIDSVIKTRDQESITRPDMLQLLMEARNRTKMDVVDIAAQAMLFFLAGFEIVANHMSLMAHEIAVNPDIQEKLRLEVEAISGGKISYDAIANMPYLNAVFMETARKHPSVPLLTRICSKPYELPPTLPGAKSYFIKKDEMVQISIPGIHYDPKIYEDPEKFEPDRFLRKKITTSDPTLLGFSMGPRACIGNRFAVLETKALFFHLLKKCTLESCEKTKNPIKYSNKIVSPAPEDGFWLKIRAR